MSITSEITRINNNIANAYSSVGNKGGTLPQVQNSANLSSAIDSIPTGGGGGSASSNDVNFYDYDGTIVHSYSASEFAELTAMPENPTHQGLTAQGWNWNLTDAKEYVAEYGMLDVGQMYVTDDGKTRIYITLEEGRLEPYLGFAINGTATVDWGDGNTEQVTGTSTSSFKRIQHNYAQSGDYVITIESEDAVNFGGTSTRGSYVLSNSRTSRTYNSVYQNAIKKVELGENVTISDSAFMGCFSLTKITIPKHITNIRSYAFSNCYSLQGITIPTEVTEIEMHAFDKCFSLTNITIPKDVANINTYAFSECYSLENITLPDNITNITSYMFHKCRSLVRITMPNDVTQIATYAFLECRSLARITMPDSITSIGEKAFQDCSSLVNIEIPSGVTSISSRAFSGCSSLANIEIPSGVTSISSSAFQGCSSLANIEIPSGVTSISSSAFSGCSSLANIEIPSGVTGSLGSNVFYECFSLPSIKIPSGITSIGTYAFRNCQGISYFDFTKHSSIPTLSNTNAFQNLATEVKIIVPDELYENWKAATNWSTYASKIVKESEA